MCKVGRKLKSLAITEPDVVIGIAFDQLDAFGLETSAEITESMVKQAWEEQE